MKKILITLLMACCFVGCSNKDDNLMDCKVFWQIYHTPKYLEESEIEHAYSTTFFNKRQHGYRTPNNPTGRAVADFEVGIHGR